MEEERAAEGTSQPWEMRIAVRGWQKVSGFSAELLGSLRSEGESAGSKAEEWNTGTGVGENHL